MEGRIQRRYMEQGMYDLCIDQGTAIIPIAGESDWSRVDSGDKIVMRVVLVQKESLRDPQTYLCPRCQVWNSEEGINEDVIIDWSAPLLVPSVHI